MTDRQVDGHRPEHTTTADASAFAGLHAYLKAYLKRASQLTDTEELIVWDAFLHGDTNGYRRGYRQSVLDQAAIGNVVPLMRRLVDLLEEHETT